MTLKETLPTILVLLATSQLLFLIANADSVFADVQGLGIEEVHLQAVVAVQTYDSAGKPMGYGSGVLLYHYHHEDSVYLLTAWHVLRDRDSVNLYLRQKGKGFKAVFPNSLPLLDDSLHPLSQMFVPTNGDTVDLALLSLPKSELIQPLKGFRVLTESKCYFSDSVFAGDRILAIGFASADTFSFVNAGYPLALSGIVAYESPKYYMIDRHTHKGMSGGVLFREFPTLGQYGYNLVGILKGTLKKDENYSFAVKIDFIDSISVANTGKTWTGK